LASSGALFLTGGTGFLGRRVVKLLFHNPQSTVRLLVRSPRDGRSAGLSDGWSAITGDLEQPGGWQTALAGADTVVHLAALTGKGSRAAHRRANLEATRSLVRAARDAGARRFLLVSSIAAGYSDRRHYHYAEAKGEAEAVVRESGLEALIVRPTMIFGPGSPVLENLRRLALLPIPVMFGPGTRLQPIHVDDAAAALVAALELDQWPSHPIELGGPEVIETEELIARIRRAEGKPGRRPIHLPLGPLRAVLGVIEPVALSVLPFTAGQLAAFANPAVARPDVFLDRLPRPRHGLDEMIGSPAR
jgi:NADH dehydrogenase